MTNEPTQQPAAATRPARRGAAAAALIALLYAASGLYSVQSDESAVAFVFGRATARDVLPGIHWNPPRPFGRVTVAQTATNFVMPVGFRFIPRPGEPPISDLWLTGDANIVMARLNVQYSIRSLYQFLTAQESPRELVRRVGERVLSRFLASEGVDAVLTTRRQNLRTVVHEGVQAELDREGIGVVVQSVTVQELAPPDEGGVRNAFQEVQNASADRERTIYEARAYQAQALAEAEGEAQILRSRAAADRHRRVALASGQSERFSALAEAHSHASRVTEQRLFLETIDRVLPAVETYVVEPGRGGNVNLRVVK